MIKTGLFALLASIMLVSTASAWTLTPPYLSYSAVFSCDSRYPFGSSDAVINTAIFIHNPHAEQTVFAKWVVATTLEGARTPPPPVEVAGSLAPNTSDYVDCFYLREVLKISPNRRNVSGVVVIEVPAQNNHKEPSALDVTETHLVKSPDHSASYSVVVIPGTVVAF